MSQIEPLFERFRQDEKARCPSRGVRRPTRAFCRIPLARASASTWFVIGAARSTVDFEEFARSTRLRKRSRILPRSRSSAKRVYRIGGDMPSMRRGYGRFAFSTDLRFRKGTS